MSPCPPLSAGGNQNQLITLKFNIETKAKTIRTTVRCPGCRSSQFYAKVDEPPVSRVVCKVCGEAYTFHSSLLVPLKQLSKNG